MLGAPLSHISLSHSTLSLSLSQVRGARTFELLARHPWYHAIVRRRRTPYVHRISMVALPVCFLFRQATGTKVYLKSSRRHTVGLASSPQVGILAVGDVAFRIPLIVLVGGLQGTRCTRPPVSSKKIRSAVPALSFRRVTLQAVRAVSVRLPRSHFLLFG